MKQQKRLTKRQWNQLFYKNKSILELTDKGYELDDAGKSIFISYLRKGSRQYIKKDSRKLVIFAEKGIISLKINDKIIKQLQLQLDQYFDLKYSKI